MNEKETVLVLGASGMLGQTVYRFFQRRHRHAVVGYARSAGVSRHLTESADARLLTGLDILNADHLCELLARARPTTIVNCIGVIKQQDRANDPLEVLPLNTLLPHRLAKSAGLIGARLVHISTDCVFDGAKGLYSEGDPPDAVDLYGRSKQLGETVEYDNAITLRTSIIGHELESRRSLLGWFLSQEGTVKGFTKAVFSGLPTVELARVIHDYVLPDRALHGLYHVAAAPIDKYSLLQLVARQYGKRIEIQPDESLRIDRSLNAGRFASATGYAAPAWPELIRKMHDFEGSRDV